MRGRIAWPAFAMALAVAVAGCASSHAKSQRAAVAHYTDASDDGGGMPDVRRVVVRQKKDGTISFHVTVGGLKPSAKTSVDLWIDADADPNTGNTSFEGADGADYILNAPIGQKLTCEPYESNVPASSGCIGQSPKYGGNWKPATAPSTRIIRTPSGVEFSINRRELGITDELNFFVYRGGQGFPDRAPGSGTFNYSLALGGPRPVAAQTTGQPADKAGGAAKKQPTVLKLATQNYNDQWAAAFKAAVDRLSGGSIKIDVRQGWRYYDLQAERATIGDVRHDDVDLAVVGARSWDLVGVKSFRALVAPFLIDSLALQRRVLDSPLAERALDGVRPLGLVGVAVFPGGLRRPLGLSRRLVAPQDYRDAEIGIRPGEVAARTFRALGGRGQAFQSTPTGLNGFDGAESDLTTILANRYDTYARGLAANVVLWPRVTTLVANAKSFQALPLDAQDVLMSAGREALAPLYASFERDDRDSLDALCRMKRLSFPLASAADRAALRRAVQPVYDELERDSLTRDLISKIAEMRKEIGPNQPLRCASSGARSGNTALEGSWLANVKAGALRAAGEDQNVADQFQGRWALEFRNGRWVARNLRSGAIFKGGYTLSGDRLREIVDSCNPPSYCQAGNLTEVRWSVYRDRLTFARIPGHTPVLALIAQPWARSSD